ncbi:DUF3757 domain-containing protein [Pseudomonas chlororaphis]|uniref:DUF3757 domain-containing protein n=1 Tax=Pseudomonas chlororaphis TaxID=587753 RepID=UPI0014717FEF|nr:DUF3757 domain-containing protein [Pseudomonas chlororaphis]MBM0284981.1 DUF3757 domain-containing protein [Pseudomonas chlororaphis]MDO1505654.1 DUF3757 domain-containing protein [Pseudomonas chlororaphis]WDG99678.1 DUF3757 domain-containing protein [Pseudomonas chlororaphis]WDH18684.1 DUF3757 domain-containing protein [Pseudomonas chlororaphis]WDH66575.1 DUF3757 domain-containing protein [Pseudomonas chlororaphis]
MSRLLGWVLLCSQLFTFVYAAPASNYLNIPDWPGDQESCPSPRDIKGMMGIFSAPAKSEGAEWVGVLVDGAMEAVTNFEKSYFVLTHQGGDKVGFINSCIYVTSGGRYLNMHLDLGGHYKQVMWVGSSLSWKESRDFSSSTILECTDTYRDACSFYLK